VLFNQSRPVVALMHGFLTAGNLPTHNFFNSLDGDARPQVAQESTIRTLLPESRFSLT
jgi:hypothetical protein